MNGRTLSTLVGLGVVMAASTCGAAVIPDFSQKANAGWTNYCAPTCGGDVVYHFGVTYPGLLQGNSWPGAQPAADNGATHIIGGLPVPDPDNAPPPPANTLAHQAYMNTSLLGGTTLLGVQTGLDNYLENFWDGAVGGADWNTQLILAAGFNPPGNRGALFFSALQQLFDAGNDVILAVAFSPQNLPGAPYELPTNPAYDGGQGDSSPIGHALVMTGYGANLLTISVNDPANLPVGTHFWVQENTVYNILQGGANYPASLAITIGGVTGTIYGAVATVPEPAMLLPLVFGCLGLLRRKR